MGKGTENLGKKIKLQGNLYIPVIFIAGRAGGGWEEDSEDEEDGFRGLCLEAGSYEDEEIDVGHTALITASQEFLKIREFVTAENPQVDLDQLIGLVDALKSAEKLNVLYSIKNVFETEEEMAIFKALVLLEKVYECSLVPVHIMLKVMRPNLEIKKTDKSLKISIKSAKILAILEHMKDFKQTPIR